MQAHIYRSLKTVASAVMAGLLMLPALATAQEVSGQARAVQATVLGATTTLSDTGTLSGVDDAREASQVTGAISELGTAEVLHAATVSSVYGWDDADFVASESSLADLGLGIAGNTISAEFVMARALAPVTGVPVSTASVEGLTVNGLPVHVTGAPNQVVPLVGGQLVINEQQTNAAGDTTVNALHLIVDGLADVVLASATAGVNGGSMDSDLVWSSLDEAGTALTDATPTDLDGL